MVFWKEKKILMPLETSQAALIKLSQYYFRIQWEMHVFWVIMSSGKKLIVNEAWILSLSYQPVNLVNSYTPSCCDFNFGGKKVSNTLA